MRQLFSAAGMRDTGAVAAWLNSYSTYARDAVAGIVLPLAFIPTLVETGDFFQSLEASLEASWRSVVWVGPGATGTIAFVPPLVPTLRSVGAQLITSYDPGLGLQLITEALHTYTLGVVVTVLAAGVSSPAPLT